MADIIGLIASIVTLADVLIKTYEYGEKIKDAPKDRAALAEEALMLLGLLNRLKNRVTEAQLTKSNEGWLNSADSSLTPILNQLLLNLSKVQRKVGPSGDTSLHRFKDRIVWPWQEKQTKEIMNQMVRLQSVIQIALHENELELLQAIQDYCEAIPKIADDVQSIETGVRSLIINRDNREREEILNWLAPPPNQSKQQIVLRTRQEGTCEWLLNSDAFQTWKNQRGGLLWCPGSPGAGKTVMASIIVDYLQKESNAQENVTFFYFEYTEKQRQRETNVFRDICTQVIDDHELPAKLIPLYEKYKTKRVNLETKDILEILQVEIQKWKKVYLVIDALDESHEDDRGRLIDHLNEMSPDVNILITSRDIPIIAEEMKAVPSIKIEARDHDMRAYISGRIRGRLLKEVQKNPQFKDQIIQKVLSNAKDMFLIARLQMDALAAQTTGPGIRKELRNLSGKLDQNYESAFVRINDQNAEVKELALKVLRWACHSYRPLKLSELQHALAVDGEDLEADGESFYTDEDDLTSCCAGLVVVEPTDSTVRLVHYTLQEYLSRNAAGEQVHERMASACLKYLLQDELDRIWNGPIENFYQTYPFAGYAARFWGKHARGVPETDDTVRALSVKFLKEKRSLDVLYSSPKPEDTYDPSPDGYWRMGGHFQGLHLAVAFGLSAILSLLLKDGSDPDQKDDLGETPLYWAAHYGRVDIAKILLDHGAEVDAKPPWNLSTPLIVASWCGQWRVASLLLERGAEVNYKCKHLHGTTTALHEACRHGHPTPHRIETIGVLLDHGASLEAEAQDYNLSETPFQLALDSHYDYVVRYLLSRGVTLSPHEGWQALRKLIISRDPATCLAIVEAGVDISYAPPGEKNNMDFALERNYIPVIAALTGEKNWVRGAREAIVAPTASSASYLQWLTDVHENQDVSQTAFSNDDPQIIRRKWRRDDLTQWTDFTTGAYLGVFVPEDMAEVEQIIFRIESHDQGWSDEHQHHGTYIGSYTWFEAFIQFNGENSPPFEKELCRNIHASYEFRVHTVVWKRDETEADVAACLRRLGPEDLIQVFAMASFQGWMNFVKSVEVELVGRKSSGVSRRSTTILN